jgi:NADH-quinone oxidoreductase subunit M
MHMGYIFLGLAAGSEIALKGAVLLMFAHGVSIALLFGLCGRMRNQLGTLEYNKLGGLATHAPAFTVLFAFGAFASIGLPGLTNFAGEVMVFAGSFTELQGGAHQSALDRHPGAVGRRDERRLHAPRLPQHLPRQRHHRPVHDRPRLSQRVPFILLAATLPVTGCCPWLLLNLMKSAL